MKKIVKRKDKSFLQKILVGYILLGIISVVIIIGLNSLFLKTIQKNNLEMNKARIEKVVDQLDNIITEMRESVVDLSLRAELEKHALEIQNTEKSHMYSRYLLRKDLLSAYLKEKYMDVFVYFPSDDYIVSGKRSTLSSQNYIKTYFGNHEETENTFNQILNYSYGYPTLGCIDAKGKGQYLYMAISHEMKITKSRYVVCIILDWDHLYDLISEFVNSFGTVLIFDQNKQVLMNCDTEVRFLLGDYDMQSEIYETEIQGEHYIMTVYPSNVFSGYYAYAMYKDYFWEQLEQIRNISIFVILGYVMLASVWIACRSKKTYAPLKNITEKIRRGEIGDQNRYQIEELNYISNAFKKQYIEKNALLKEERRNKCLNRLVRGVGVESKETDQMMEENGIETISDLFVVGIIIQENEVAYDRKTADFIIKNVMEEIFDRDNKGYVFPANERENIFLLNLEKDDCEKQIAFMVEEAKNFLSAMCHFELSIAMSGIGKGINEIKELFAQANRAMKYRYILGKEKIIYWKQVKDRKFSYANSEKEKTAAILNSMFEKDGELISAEECVHNIFSVCKINEEISMEAMECLKVDIINCVNLIMVQKNVLLEDRHIHILELMEKESIKEFESYLVYVLALIRKIATDSGNNEDICSKTKKYLKDNYMNPQLSLAFVAEKMNLSPSYITKSYKKSFGVSIVDDITYVRLQEAKRLLLDTNLSIIEIAEKTGFSNNNVFGKVFKKWEGITPSDFRKYEMRRERTGIN